MGMHDERYERLTRLQTAWAEIYALSRDATNAAKQAGYSERSAKCQGHRNRHNDLLMDYVREIRREAWGEQRMELEEALAELASIARDPAAKAGDRVRAAAELSKICGWNSPERTQSEIRVVIDAGDEDV